MANILVLLAHPLFERSRVHLELLKAARQVKGVTINDLYERYPDFDIEIEREKRLLLSNDIIIWQHPFYWYSAPPLLKQWQDLVLEHGWAYGKKGTALAGKKVFNVLTSGAGKDSYTYGGFNKYPLHEYLRPFERTVELCRMTYWPPFWIDGVHRMAQDQILRYSDQYRNLLAALAQDIFWDVENSGVLLMNDLIPITTMNNNEPA